MDDAVSTLTRDPAVGGLTTGAVARLLGVAPTTLRSWDRRYGIGPASREGGRHRRWTAADIRLLECMCGLTNAGLPPAEAARAALASASQEAPARPEEHKSGSEQETRDGQNPRGERKSPDGRPASRAPGALPIGRARRECRGLARAAVRLDAQAMDELLAEAIDRHGLLAAWESVIMPTLHAVGRKWETAGERYVEVEHLLSWHVSSALRRAASQRAPAAGSGVSLLACTPGESHTLALEALAAGLAQQGLPVRMFGAALPVEAMEEAVRRTGPAAVVLWAQSRSTASRALVARVESIEWGVRGARRRPVVLAAGPGWAGQLPPGARHPSGLAEALDALAAISRR
ncbi:MULTISPECIES: MerR family transcriptional regulator [unclassified Streptomyces]|uniref:MerR family transcriptional regulator n=1 Tax=unclassified Streptomyces TaxID=2593676 RepID=UPI00081E93FA|nr:MULTISPECIES: MerR family transcriptional regulator [unclassified Streptomyces]MYR94461.1 MerR family transcriptional regulator [Streptomyces sp. SID4937]SCD71957.1 DNA-binding transcriptional regulator, MerR family [Streptomyces sp. ScaeMP-e83]